MKYQEKQIGWIILIPFILLIIWNNIAFMYKIGSDPVTSTENIIMTIFFVLVCLLFFQMKTYVDEDKIVIKYGIGIIRKTVKLSSISRAETTRNSWYNGIGIRKLQNGWLYNIHGMDAVELNYKNSRSVIRIGSQKPLEFRNAIRTLIEK